MDQVKVSKLKCDFSKLNQEMFFSLVDYRNNYFSSSDPEKIIEFYEGFENRDQLIKWMKERPKGISKIFEVEGNKEIIVVIPTADYEGKYAKQCRDNIFKGLHIIFVESGRDYYFNYAHNCNIGVKKAMTYNPKWVVVSNDDMYKIDDVKKLRESLTKLHDGCDIVFTNEGIYHSRDVLISTRTIRRNLVVCLIGRLERSRLRMEKKFKIELIIGTTLNYRRYLYKPIKRVRYTGAFGIFSRKFVQNCNYKLYNETYINGTEDIDLSLRIYSGRFKVEVIDYSIGDLIGQTIGPYNKTRRIRGLVNDCYFNHKVFATFNNFVINEN